MKTTAKIQKSFPIIMTILLTSMFVFVLLTMSLMCSAQKYKYIVTWQSSEILSEFEETINGKPSTSVIFKQTNREAEFTDRDEAVKFYEIGKKESEKFKSITVGYICCFDIQMGEVKKEEETDKKYLGGLRIHPLKRNHYEEIKIENGYCIRSGDEILIHLEINK